MLGKALSVPKVGEGLAWQASEEQPTPVVIAWEVGVFVVCASFLGLWSSFFQLVDSAGSAMAFALWGVMAVCWGMAYSSLYRYLRGQLLELVRTASLLMGGIMLTCFSCNVAYMMHTPGPILKDAGFALIPRAAPHSFLGTISEVCTISSFLIVLAISLPTRNVRMLNTWARLMGVVYALRSLTLWNTSLPGPADHCTYESPKYNPPLNVFHVLSRFGQIWGTYATCGDLLFSGHTGFFLVSVLTTLKFVPSTRPRLQLAARVYAAVYCVLFIVGVIAARKHYTADVMLGVIITLFVYDRFADGWTRPAAEPSAAVMPLPPRKDSSDKPAHQATAPGSLTKSRSYHMV
mmetsp:Transcript_24250/g.77859  ORF Transcript_24250/g.77859 Transcript_24250/m.77859 type:complete len:348 (+) Transcript_24250:41-1084(+)